MAVQVVSVTSISDLKAVDPVLNNTVIVTHNGRGGQFVWRTSTELQGKVSRPLPMGGQFKIKAANNRVVSQHPHGLLTGQSVCATTATGNVSANRPYFVAVSSPTEFHLADSFAAANNGTYITLGADNVISLSRMMDPIEGVYVIRNGGAVDGSAGAWARSDYLDGADIEIRWFGAVADAIADDTPAFFFALDLCEKQPSAGGVVRAGQGLFRITSKLRIGSRTTLRGSTMYASVMYFGSEIISGNLIELGPDNCVGEDGNLVFPPLFGQYVFGARIEDFDIKGGALYRNELSAIIYTQGAHQPSGLLRCFIRDVVTIGVFWDKGLGGPANFSIEHCDIEAAPVSTPSGIPKVGLYCNGAGAVVDVDTVNVQGSDLAKFDAGILMDADNLSARGLHFENCLTGVSFRQNLDTPRWNVVEGATGHSTVPVLINRASTNKNTLTAMGVSNISSAAIGLTVIRDNGVALYSDTAVPLAVLTL